MKLIDFMKETVKNLHPSTENNVSWLEGDNFITTKRWVSLEKVIEEDIQIPSNIIMPKDAFEGELTNYSHHYFKASKKIEVTI